MSFLFFFQNKMGEFSTVDKHVHNFPCTYIAAVLVEKFTVVKMLLIFLDQIKKKDAQSCSALF